jgi:hypothetical protein
VAKKGNVGPQASRPARRRAQAEFRDAMIGIESNKPGRPSPYRKSYNSIVRGLALVGFTDAELARHFNVSIRAFENWKVNQPTLMQALNAGREEADQKIADSLFHRALGYHHKDTYITQYQGRIITREIIKYYPPDTAAAIFWLKNRQFEKWRDRVEYVPPAGDAAKALREQMAAMDAATTGKPAKGKGTKS